MDFVAIDFEWGKSSESNSICQAGYTIVKNFEIIKTKNQLIKAPQLEFGAYEMRKHHITPEMLINEPTFDKFWPELESVLNGQLILAHSPSNDIVQLRGTLKHYSIDLPKLDLFCSKEIAKKTAEELNWELDHFDLPMLCNFFKITPPNHSAGEDARACAEVSVKIFKEKEINSVGEVKEIFGSTRKSLLNIINIQIEANSNNLEGRRFVVSGFSDHEKDQIMRVIKANGGIVLSGVSCKTDFLVAGYNVGPVKKAKAQQLGVKIISADELMNIFKDGIN
jgi:DNA polymerase-3 subunit epsilon